MTEKFASLNKREIPDRKILAFDIETYKWEECNALVEKVIEEKMDKRLKDPAKVEENIKSIRERFALSPLTGQIIVCGFWDGENYVPYIRPDYPDEATMIKVILEYIGNAHFDGYRLLSKGGKRFDLPYLLHRAMILGITPKFNVEWSRLTHQYQHWDHIDLESFFDGGLYTIAYACGLTDQFKNPGNEIGMMYEVGDMKTILEKNQEDLVLTYKLYERLKWANL